MKKVLLLIAVCTAALPALASTCETRVDSHQKASTKERVDYCLTEESESSQKAGGPQVIYSQVLTNAPVQDEEEDSRALKQRYYPQEDVEVARNYVGSERFPQFKNDIPSEQERLAANAVALQEKETATRTKPGRVMYPQTAVRDTLTDEQPTIVVKNVKGYTKPTRFMERSVATQAATQPTERQFVEKTLSPEDLDWETDNTPNSLLTYVEDQILEPARVTTEKAVEKVVQPVRETQAAAAQQVAQTSDTLNSFADDAAREAD